MTSWPRGPRSWTTTGTTSDPFRIDGPDPLLGSGPFARCAVAHSRGLSTSARPIARANVDNPRKLWLPLALLRRAGQDAGVDDRLHERPCAREELGGAGP